MKRVLLFLIHREPSVAESTALRSARKTLRSLRKKALSVIRTARSSRKDVVEWIATAVNLGGIAEACLSSHMGRKAFCFRRDFIINKMLILSTP